MKENGDWNVAIIGYHFQMQVKVSTVTFDCNIKQNQHSNSWPFFKKWAQFFKIKYFEMLPSKEFLLPYEGLIPLYKIF